MKLYLRKGFIRMFEKKPINITFRSKCAEWKERAIEMKDNTIDWCKENKALAAGLGIAVLKLGGKAVKAVARIHCANTESRNRDLRCYDASLGHYWELKRKLRKEDWLKIDRRKRSGERLGDILNDLGVLK